MHLNLLSHLKYHLLVLKVLQSNLYLSIYFFSTLNLSFDVKWDNSGAKNKKNLDCFLGEEHFPIFHFVTGCG